MDNRLQAAVSPFAANCEGERFRSQIQYCISVEKQILAAAEAFLPHVVTCKSWTGAEIRAHISASRNNIAFYNETAAGNSSRSRRGGGGGGGYSGPSNNYVGPNIGYSACQRFLIQADGSKYCY